MLSNLKKQKIIVLDTSAFIAGFDPSSVNNNQYSVPEVRNELATNSLSMARFDTAVESGILIIQTPKAEHVERIRSSSKAVGDLLFLSEADQKVLAIALELKVAGNSPQIITDDYSIQNVANQLGIDFASLITFGIRYRFQWTLYCPACHRRYSADYKTKHCKICGTMLKRKPLRKKPL